MENGKWVTSYNDEMFLTNDYFDTIEEAVEFGKSEYDNLYGFYVGQVYKEPVNTRIDGGFVLDIIGENVYEQFGEVSEDYLSDVKSEHVKELDEWLNKVIQHWMDYYEYTPNYFRVDNVQYISISEDDSDE